MTYLHEIKLGDPKIGVKLESGLVLRTEEKFKMIRVKRGVLLKGRRTEFLIEKIDDEKALIRLWDQPYLFKPPQIHLLRALLKMKCSCSTCKRRTIRFT